MSTAHPRIVECRNADEGLHSVCAWCYEDRLSAEGCAPVEAAALPPAYQELLVHHEHMTSRLQRYHGNPVTLEVLHERRDGNLYSRNVLLRVAGHVVEFGIVRLDLDLIPATVRGDILAEETPLGEILINHDVLRRIEPCWYYRFEQDAPLVGHFKDLPGPAFGRVGIIHCDHQPGIELLEIVTDVRA